MILLLACAPMIEGLDASVDVALSQEDRVLLTIGSCTAWSTLEGDFLAAADELDEEAALAAWSTLPEDFWEFRIHGDALIATHVLRPPVDLYSDDWVQTFAGEGEATDQGWEGTIDGISTTLRWTAEPCDTRVVVERPLYSTW